jgi:hypothetical protein
MLLGELLVSQGLASEQDIRLALSRQERLGGRIGENLIALGIIDRETIKAALDAQYEQAKAILAREDMLRRTTQRFGVDHPQTDRQRCVLAFALIAGWRPGEALEVAQRALAGHEKALGTEHHWTIDAEQAVANARAALAPKPENPVVSPRKRPAVAARVGAGEQHPVRLATNDLDAARPVEVADRVDRVSALGKVTSRFFKKPALDRQHVGSFMRVIGVLAGRH